MDKFRLISSERIVSLEENADITFRNMIEQLSNADYVLLGETHDNPAHHRLQDKILVALINAKRQPAVVFEMFNREDAGTIASISRRYPNEPDRIADAVDWGKTGWPDWKMYRPIVKTAMDAGLPVIAGNLSRWEIRRMLMKGIPPISKETAIHMGLMVPLPEQQEEELRKKINAYHESIASPQIVAGMLLAQRTRDAILADAMISHNRGDGAVLIAGREHTRADYGVPFYLAHREPDAIIASLVFTNNDDEATSMLKLADSMDSRRSYDFVWVLSADQAQDHDEQPRVAHQQDPLDTISP